MAEPKTRKNSDSVDDFIAGAPDPERREDARALCALIADVTGVAPAMWGSSIVGFGSYHYRYASGREGDWPPVGFSPRKQALTLYLAQGADPELLSRLGRHRTGKSCLHLRRLADADEQVLRSLIERCFRDLDGRTITAEPT